MVSGIREDVIHDLVAEYIPPQTLEENWDVPQLMQVLEAEYGVQAPISTWLEEDKSLDEQVIAERVHNLVKDAYEVKSEAVGETMRLIEKQVLLQVVDQHWKDHLQNMDHLRQGVNLRAYAQKNPKQEYKRESFELFGEMLNNIKSEIIRFLSVMQINRRDEAEELERRREQEAQQEMKGAKLSGGNEPKLAAGPKVGRNEPCPCGSGLKFKHCHGKLS